MTNVTQIILSGKMATSIWCSSKWRRAPMDNWTPIWGNFTTVAYGSPSFSQYTWWEPGATRQSTMFLEPALLSRISNTSSLVKVLFPLDSQTNFCCPYFSSAASFEWITSTQKPELWLSPAFLKGNRPSFVMMAEFDEDKAMFYRHHAPGDLFGRWSIFKCVQRCLERSEETLRRGEWSRCSRLTEGSVLAFFWHRPFRTFRNL